MALPTNKVDLAALSSRATKLFDVISLSTYYGMDMRLILMEDEAAAEAAAVLCARLAQLSAVAKVRDAAKGV